MKKKKTACPKSRTSALKAAVNFFAEAGLLKKIKRSGWWVAGIKDPETVAEHSFRTAVIALYLAKLEKVDPYQTMVMALFNDIHEARINDLHKMGHYYIDFKSAEKKVFHDQMKDLHAEVSGFLREARDQYDRQSSREGVVARDADILECLLQAKEYYDRGHSGAKAFFNRAPQYLKTKSARSLWNVIKTWDSHEWWKPVVKFER